MKHFAIPLVVSLAAAACGSSGPGAQQSAVDSAAAAEASADLEPLAEATSPCGRYTLHLENAEWGDEPGPRPQVSLQFVLRTGEPDVLLVGDARVTANAFFVSDGREFLLGDIKGSAMARDDSRTLVSSRLEVRHRDDQLRRLRVETRVLRVFAWKSYDVSWEGPDARSKFVCAPFTVFVSGGPTQCHVGAAVQDGWRDFPAHQRDLVDILGSAWVASSATLTDASGRRLLAGMGVGSGGSATVGYSPDVIGDPAPNAPPPTLAWPVRGTIRLPDRYVVEIVPFEFADFTLTRGDGAARR